MNSLTRPVPMTQELIHQLLHTPQAFGHAAPGLQCLQTHISWIVLAGAHAYKFKKPLALDFLDYSTAAKRLAACEEELRINRRTAPALYLGVVAVTGPLEAPRVVAREHLAPDTPVLDWAVHMRRFAQEALLSEHAAHGTLRPEHIDALAHQVARFHQDAAVAADQHDWGQPQALRAAVTGNFATLHQAPLDPAQQALLASLETWSQTQSERLAPLLTQRRQQGWVRECHGDLHLGNLVMVDGQPQLFDAIEFNPDFRWIDVLADLAFLRMDLQAHGHDDLATRLLNTYLELTGDYAGLPLLTYYTVYRALVRAKVAALPLVLSVPAPGTNAPAAPQDTAAVSTQASDSALADARQALQRYLALAQRLTQPMPCALWLTTGLSGSGKSSQTQPLIEARGLIRLKADVERKRLFGLPPLARSEDTVPGGIYTPQATERTYARLAELAHSVLSAGWPVLVDATCLRRAQRDLFRQVARAHDVPCQVLALQAPLSVLRERIMQRSQTAADPSEANLAVLEAQLRAQEPLGADELADTLVIDTRRPVDWTHWLPPADTASPPPSHAPA